MIFTDGSVRVKAGTILTNDYWIAQAKGVKDEYGNPFRVVTLRWNWSATNKCSEFEKTLGYEDAVIGRNKKTGGIQIRYRTSGSIQWNRPIGGVGDFQALCPITPKNLTRLASEFPNNKYRIVDDDIRAVVEKMWKLKLKGMDKETREFNEQWFKDMHTRDIDRGKSGAGRPEVDIDTEKKKIEDENLEIARRKQDQDLKDAELTEREKDLVEKTVDSVDGGKQIVKYSKEFLTRCGLTKIKKIIRQGKMGKVIKVGDNTDDLPRVIDEILKFQDGQVPDEKKEKEQVPALAD